MSPNASLRLYLCILVLCHTAELHVHCVPTPSGDFWSLGIILFELLCGKVSDCKVHVQSMCVYSVYPILYTHYTCEALVFLCTCTIVTTLVSQIIFPFCEIMACMISLCPLSCMYLLQSFLSCHPGGLHTHLPLSIPNRECLSPEAQSLLTQVSVNGVVVVCKEVLAYVLCLLHYVFRCIISSFKSTVENV